ncbi:MAG: helix-turn-helix domain-containing protein [Prevotellaceae bacterium]|jgi:transcriptional regulator with XRE-family HTH domain|nr:helix-turn-helix domain-containing protein [Prevotellaceae bacterium]
MVNLLKIKEIAKLKRITIRELAMAANITEQGLQRLIRTNSTTVETIDLIAKKLEVPVGVFFDEISLGDVLAYNNSRIGNINGHDNTAIVGQGNYVNGGNNIAKESEVKELKAKIKNLEANVTELTLDKRYLQKLIDKKQ